MLQRLRGGREHCRQAQLQRMLSTLSCICYLQKKISFEGTKENVVKLMFVSRMAAVGLALKDDKVMCFTKLEQW